MPVYGRNTLRPLDKRGISSVVLEKQLGISQKTAWLLLQKLRKAMGEREAQYKLEGFVELDECFFISPREGGSRRRQKTKTRVLAGLSLTKEGKPLHIKFKVLPCNDRPHLEQAVESMVAPGATVVTNGLRSYLSLGGKGFLHERVLAGGAKASEKGPSGVMYYTPTTERSPLLYTASCVRPPVYGRNTLRPPAAGRT